MRSCRVLEDLLLELSVFTSDPYCFIHDTINSIRNQVDIRREEAKLQIDKQAEALIDELDAYETECKNHALGDRHLLERYKRLEKSLVGMKYELEDWFQDLTTISKNGKSSIGADDNAEIKWNNIKNESEKRAVVSS